MSARGRVVGVTLTWQNRLFLAAFVVLLVCTLALVTQTYRNLDRADAIHERSTKVLTNMTNVQREAMLLGRLVQDPASDHDEIQLRHSLLHNQTRVLERQLHLLDVDLTTPLQALLRSELALEELFHHPGPRSVGHPELGQRLDALELSAKRLYDATEQAFFAAFADANRSRELARLALLALALATSVVGCGTALSLRRRVGSAFSRAYAALEKEIEQRRASEAAVEAQAAQLARYAERLEAVNSDLVEADEMKNKFLSVVSHELRTPLTTILGLGTTVATRYEALTDHQRRDFSGRIVNQAKRQMRLIDDLLDLSEILNRRITTRPVRLIAGESLARIIADVYHPDTRDPAEIQLQGDLHAPVYVDLDHLTQIVTNLVTNAFKYGASPIVITVTNDGNTTSIDVTDHGEGVPAGFVPHMFDAFSQSSTGDQRTATGLGLGLAIVQELTSANGGVITYAAGDATSTFTVRLPADDGQMNESPSVQRVLDASRR